MKFGVEHLGLIAVDASTDDAVLDALADDLGGLNENTSAGREDGADEIPAGLVEYVASITRSDWIRTQVLEAAAMKVLRRLRHDTREARRARWEKRWAQENRGHTRHWLGQVRDRVVRQYHQGQVAEHATYGELPKSLLPWRPDSTGALVIDEPEMLTPSFGSPAFLEATPVKVLRWVDETWLSERLAGLDDDVGLEGYGKPKIWDLTGGSGTALDYFGALQGCDVVSTDVVVVRAAGVTLADCRDVGAIAQHGGARRPLIAPEMVIARPDLILFDPPSMGIPTHSELYGDGPIARDLALLERDEYLAVIAEVVEEGVRHLAEGGFLSLVLRCGSRLHSEVLEDAEIAPDFMKALEGRAVVTHEMPVVYRSTRNQTSLGKSRVPAVHLRIEAKP